MANSSSQKIRGELPILRANEEHAKFDQDSLEALASLPNSLPRVPSSAWVTCCVLQTANGGAGGGLDRSERPVRPRGKHSLFANERNGEGRRRKWKRGGGDFQIAPCAGRT